MRFEIQERIDLSGTMTTVRIPEGQLDKSALYTLQADMPDFVVPFHYRVIDGFVECTYEVERYTKLQYFFNKKTADEYIAFWQQLLQPLLDCGDWFLNPFSFVLDTKYLYVDKSGKKISYLYIPATEPCMQFDDLKNMVIDLFHKNPVMDQSIENKVLRSIMQGFQPKTFLQMLSSAKQLAPVQQPQINEVKRPARPVQEAVVQEPISPAPAAAPKDVSAPVMREEAKQPSLDGNDIVINFADVKGGKKEKKPDKKEKKPKKEKKEKGWGGLFGKKEPKAEEKELRFGTAENHMDDSQGEIPAINIPAKKEKPCYTPLVAQTPAVSYADADEFDGETMLDEGLETTHLRLIGDPSLPKEIRIEIQPHQIFSVGRYDITVGHKQSSFEFEKNTKAVSRHHAAIERQENGTYTIVDLSSSAGTFVQGKRLTPNVPHLLQSGDKVSFGTSGADYIWEERSV